MDKKLEIDRLFNDIREIVEENTFQNMKNVILEIFDEYDVPYVATNKPKRSYFVGEELHKSGFVIYYNLKKGDKFKSFKEKVESRFSGIFVLTFNRGKVPNRGFVEVINKETKNKNKEETNEI